MPDRLLALGDMGASETRVMIARPDGFFFDQQQVFPTVVDDYKGSVQRIADAIEELSSGTSEVVAASIAIAATADETGTLIQAGWLTPWVGRNFAGDIATATGLSADRVGTPNDVAAIGISQQAWNAKVGRPVKGVGATLSTGFNASFYGEEGAVRGGEEGHEHLREGAVCTCGQDGHVEAWITGQGVEINHGMAMEDWLRDPQAADQIVADIAETFVNLLGRQEREYGFIPEEVRWTGGVALKQPFIMQRAAGVLREQLGSQAPSFDTATYAGYAGLHGTFVDATRRMLAA